MPEPQRAGAGSNYDAKRDWAERLTGLKVDRDLRGRSRRPSFPTALIQARRIAANIAMLLEVVAQPLTATLSSASEVPT